MEGLPKLLSIFNFRTMKRFLIKCLVLSFIVGGLLCIFSSRYSIIPFFVSVSTDSKIYELKQRHFDTIENISMGSSMTLNNLNSEILTKHLQTDSYWNMASWGRTIGETKDMIEIMTALYHPSNIFIISYCGDFRYGSMDKCKSDVRNYLTIDNKSLNLFYMTKYQLRCRFQNEDEQYVSYISDTMTYTNLNYDPYGGCVLRVYGNDVSAERMASKSDFSFDITNQSYQDLKDMCEYLQKCGVKLYFVNSPTKNDYYTNQEDVNAHIRYCDSLVSYYGHCYINEMIMGKYREDTITFADPQHLNETGAKQLTTEICKYIQ